ncbi:sensor histidine kinase [Sinosporangium siamense]|uniref:histidine kinase n=1 Tax=Sinosporangium siamense TaxID=1367973 RepID=A0A919V8V0_9ACTN|nr:histidine kinase [Sinosporangium siamense]GII93617.1 two-component sensor histidine kinase [Sinosporangium siamense]
MRLQGFRPAWDTGRARAVDVFLAVVAWLVDVLAVFTLVGPSSVSLFSGAGPVPAIAAVLLSTLGSLALLKRRTHPTQVMWIIAILDMLRAFSGRPDVQLYGFGPSVATYSLGRYARSTPSWITCAAISALYLSFYALATYIKTGRLLFDATYVIGPVLFALIGQLVRVRVELRRRSAKEAADNAVRAERRRIARELHDVVAHHISVISVMVGAGRSIMTTRPDDAQEALATAERTAREALNEMRQLLNVLRADGSDQSDAEGDTPTSAGTAGLPALIEQVRQAGLPAELTLEGESVPLPTAVDHAVYRIVQEALTNTRKHSGGARASVRLAYGDGTVEVEVLDDGIGVSEGGGGYGLSGMAERVALCGGELQTGPRPDGGFRVRARIPLPVLQNGEA